MCKIKQVFLGFLIFYNSCSKSIAQDLNKKIEVFQAIPCIYDSVRDFKNSFARVKLNGKWGFIDKDGNEIIKLNLDNYPTNFSDGLCRINENNNEIGYYINNKGEKVSPNYSYASDYHEGLACVEFNNWKGLIDLNGTKILECNCKNTNFLNELLKVDKGKEETIFIDKKGKIVLSLPFISTCDRCYYTEKNTLIINGASSNRFFSRILDYNGDDLIPTETYIVEDYYDEMALLINYKEYVRNYNCYFNLLSKKIIGDKYKEAKNFSEGLAAVKIKDKWGFIDKNGKIVIQPIYDKAYYFREGYCIIKINGKYGIIDKSGKFLISPKFEDVDCENGLRKDWGTIVDGFNGGFINVKFNGKWGVINTFGNNVTKFKYDYISKFSEGIAVVKIGDKYGYVDKFGNELTPFIYDEAYVFNEGFSRFKLNGKYGYISKK